MKIIKMLGIKDIFTLINALFGFSSIIIATTGNIVLGSFLIFFAAIFDYLDGSIARATKLNKFGKELDSLADIVSFGVTPAYILFLYTIKNSGIEGFLLIVSFLISFFFLSAGLLRLARFNITEQTDFTGLPIPAAAMALVFSISMGLSPQIAAIYSLLLSYHMVSDIKYMSQKQMSSRQIILNSAISIIIFLLLYYYSRKVLGVVGSIIAALYIISPVIRKKPSASQN